MKGLSVSVVQTDEGAWTIKKGPGNTEEEDEEGDWREGVTLDGDWELQYFDGTDWSTIKQYPKP